MKKDDGFIIPNFVGGSLPRCDRGDREYYCCTMLTLFSPWRSGKDLKIESKTWDETFTEYEFSKRQQELMKYFNVRYECLDARDDYSAMRKNTEDQGIFPQWTTNEILDDLDEDELNSGENFEDDNHISEAEYDRIGDEGRRVVEQMMEMDNIVKNCGWMNESIDGAPECDINAIQPERMQGAAKWDAVVQAKKQEILEERKHHMPTHPTSKKNPEGEKSDDNVKKNSRQIIFGKEVHSSGEWNPRFNRWNST
jgi:hypothetical protein